MKFAQSLEDHLVPEWRAQYLDYKTGKKKLKKLVKKPSVLDSIKSTPLLGGKSPNIGESLNKNNGGHSYPLQPKTRPSPKETHTATPLLSVREVEEGPSTNADNAEEISTPKGNHFMEDQITLESGGSSFALPAAALSVDNEMYGSTSPLPANRVKAAKNGTHDRTPLLVQNSRQQPSSVSFATTPKPSPSLSERNKDFVPQRRKSSISALLESFKRSPSFTVGRSSSTELDDLALYARQQFIAWVDSELEKVNSFYTERENACVDRVLVLQDQIIQLENQKQLSKKRWLQTKKALQVTPNSISANNIVGDGDIEDDFDDEDEEEDDDDENGYDEYMHSGVFTGYNNINYGVFNVAQRNFKLLSFWTRRKLRIINKFDMPSLPTFEWLKQDGKVEKQYYEDGYYSDDDDEGNGGSDAHTNDRITSSTAHIRDFQRRRRKSAGEELAKNSVPYFVARRMIKKAVYELYRSMELLKSYRLMNRIAFRKLMKKYDKSTGDSLMGSYMKKVDETYFSKSDVLDNLMTTIEELYTRYFENGNRKVSIAKLRTSAVERTYYVADYIGGLFIGVALPFVIYSIYLGLHKTISGELVNGKYLLQIWGGFMLMIVMSWLFSINCLVWTKFKVNYKFIFEFNQHDTLDFKQYMVLPSLFLFLGGIIAWLSFEDFWPHEFSGYDFPWVFLAVTVLILFCPFDMFFLNARLWLLSTFTRLLLSGFYPVEFRDFFLGDIFCSLTYSISNVSMFFCIYSKHWNNCVSCGSAKSRVLGFLQCLPSIWRFLQCFRRYADTGDWFPHLANMGKYTVSMLYYMSLSLYRIETIKKYKVLLIFWAATNSVYSSIWDIVMDWSLFQFDSKHFLLRDEITFKYPSAYYLAMVTDVILRFQWIFYVLFPTQIQQSAITSFCIAIAEILRRFVWIFFRMENEHATNVHLFRASRESPLPYSVIKRQRNALKSKHGMDDDSKDITEQDIRRRGGYVVHDLERGDGAGGTNTTTGATGVHVQTPKLAFANSSGVRFAGSHNGVRSTMLPEKFQTPGSKTDLSATEDGQSKVTDGSSNGSNGYTSGVVSSVSRYVQQLSQVMRNAHIKDFQRRKVNKKRMMQEEEAAEEEEAADEDDDDGDDDDGRRRHRRRS